MNKTSKFYTKGMEGLILIPCCFCLAKYWLIWFLMEENSETWNFSHSSEGRKPGGAAGQPESYILQDGIIK